MPLEETPREAFLGFVVLTTRVTVVLNICVDAMGWRPKENWNPEGASALADASSSAITAGMDSISKLEKWRRRRKF